MIGHCGGLRNHQDIGDFVLATAYLRGDHVLDDVLPTSVPVTPNHRLNATCSTRSSSRGARTGSARCTRPTTATGSSTSGRRSTPSGSRRSVAVDMESATIATNGFRYRMPERHPALRVGQATARPAEARERGGGVLRGVATADHLDIALEAIDRVRREHPDGMPAADIRSADEPLFGRD